ncbi:MAG: oligosaccharide flippase family protein [Bacteroidota bacterium]
MGKGKYIRNTLVYTILGFIPLASSFLLTPIFTYRLSLADYGFIALATIFQTYLSFFIGFGIDSGFSRFYFKYFRKPQLTSALFSTTLVSIVSVALIVLVMLQFSGAFLFSMFFTDVNFRFSEYGNLIFINSLFTLIYSLYAQFYRDRENVKSFTFLAITYFTLVTVGSLLGLFYIGGPKGVLIGRTVGTVITTGIFLINFYSGNKMVFKWSYAKEMYLFGYPMLFYGLLSTSFESIDRFLINHYSSLTKVGEYNLALVIVSVTGIIINSLNSALGPSLLKIFSEKDAQNGNRISSIYRMMLASTLLVSTLCIALAAPVVYFAINASYHGCVIYIPALAMAFVFRVYYIFYSNPLFFNYKTGFLPLINLISVGVGLVTGIAFIKLWGMAGVCAAVFAIKATQAGMAYIFIRRSGYYQKSDYRVEKLNGLFMFLSAFIVIIMILQTIYKKENPAINTLPFILSVIYIGRLYLKGYFVNDKKEIIVSSPS